MGILDSLFGSEKPKGEDFLKAVQDGELGRVKNLLDKGANINFRSENGSRSALDFAVESKKIDMVKLLIEKGSDVNSSTPNGYTALMFAVIKGYLEIAKLLLEKKANVNSKSRVEGWTPLLLAANGTGALFSKDDMVVLLIDNGANVNDVNIFGDTALILASRYGRLEGVKSLLQHNANVNLINKDGFDALLFATLVSGKEQFIKNFEIEFKQDTQFYAKISGAQVKFYPPIDTLADEIAEKAFSNQIIIIKLLLDEGANPNTHSNEKGPPIVIACTNGNLELVQLLLDHNADPNFPYIRGETPIMTATWNGYDKIVKLLLQKGADIKSKMTTQETAQLWAEFCFSLSELTQQKNNEEVTNILMNYFKRNTNQQDKKLIDKVKFRLNLILSLFFKPGSGPNGLTPLPKLETYARLDSLRKMNREYGIIFKLLVKQKEPEFYKELIG